MLSFLQFLTEVLKPIPGNDAGFEALHDLGQGHQVYLKISHLGGGHHKVTALYKAPEAKPGQATVKRSGMASVPTSTRVAAVNRVFADVKHFVDHNDWNSLTLGGSDAKNKAMYRMVGDKMARQSGGTFEARPIAGAGVKLVKSAQIAQPKSTGAVPKPDHDELEPYRSRVKDGSGSSSQSRSSHQDRSSYISMDAMSGNKSAPSGKWGPSGWKKNKGDSGAAGAGSESGESSGSSA